MRGVSILLLVAPLIVCGIGPAAAHPHIWIDAEEALRFDDQGRIAAIRARWRFDDLYSAYSIEGLDTDRDGAYSASELASLATEMLSSLQPYGYFTLLTADDRTLAFVDGIDLKLSVDSGILVLDLDLPLIQPVDPRRARVELRILDATYYVALNLAEVDPVRLEGAVPDGCTAVVEPPHVSDDRGTTLDDSLATNLDLARSYALDFAPSIRVACS